MADFRDLSDRMSKMSSSLIFIGVAIGLIFLAVLKMSITLNSGEAGVLFKTFAGGVNVDQTYGEGFHIIAPWDKMIRYDVRQREVLEQMAGISVNGLENTVDISGW